MYVLRSKLNNAYFYINKNNQNKIITFETIQEAQKALQMFQEFCIQSLLAAGDMFGVGAAQVTNSFKLDEVTEKNKFDNTVSFEELMDEKGYEI